MNRYRVTLEFTQTKVVRGSRGKAYAYTEVVRSLVGYFYGDSKEEALDQAKNVFEADIAAPSTQAYAYSLNVVQV